MPGRPTLRSAFPFVSALVAAGVVALTGCNGMDSIDRRVERLVGDGSTRIGGDSPAPAFRHPVERSYDRAGQADKHPSTVNPLAEQMEYTPAETSPEKVLARLQAYAAPATDPRKIDLRGAFQIAQQSAREVLSAEEDYLLTAISLLIERHQWGPRFFDDLAVDFLGSGSDANFDSALTVINQLRVTQRLPYGGEVEARLVSRAVQQLSGVAGDQYTDANSIVLSGSVPLLRNAGLIAQEDLIQAERNLVYAARDFEDFRRRFLVEIARDYFDLIAQQAAIKNQERRLESVRQFEEQTKAKVAAGRSAAFEARRVEQDVLSSQNSLINAKETYILSLDRFKVRLGISAEVPIEIQPITFELAEPDVTVTRAAELALLYRLDYQNIIDRVDDSRRAVDNARNQLLPDLDVTASASFPTDPSRQRGRLKFDSGEAEYGAGVVFSLPLDREIERLSLRSTIIALERDERSLQQFRDNLVIDARGAVREIDRARLSVELQRQTVELNELRLEELKIKEAEIEPRDRLDAETDLLDARNEYDAAVRDLRTSILDYLVITGQMRVNPDGTFRPLQGMTVRMDPGPEPSPDELQPVGPPGDPAGVFEPPPPDPAGAPPPE